MTDLEERKEVFTAQKTYSRLIEEGKFWQSEWGTRVAASVGEAAILLPEGEVNDIVASTVTRLGMGEAFGQPAPSEAEMDLITEVATEVVNSRGVEE